MRNLFVPLSTWQQATVTCKNKRKFSVQSSNISLLSCKDETYIDVGRYYPTLVTLLTHHYVKVTNTIALKVKIFLYNLFDYSSDIF